MRSALQAGCTRFQSGVAWLGLETAFEQAGRTCEGDEDGYNKSKLSQSNVQLTIKTTQYTLSKAAYGKGQW